MKKFKADWKKVDDWGWNILHEAAVNGDKELISFIMKVHIQGPKKMLYKIEGHERWKTIGGVRPPGS